MKRSCALADAQREQPIRLLGYCVLPNHWHLLLWPETDGSLSRFVGWLTLTHTQRWHAYRGSAGSGHVYQGRFKSFVVETDEHLLTVHRYVERNALRAQSWQRPQKRGTGAVSGSGSILMRRAGPNLPTAPWPCRRTGWNL